jgi:hypothetical protein
VTIAVADSCRNYPHNHPGDDPSSRLLLRPHLFPRLVSPMNPLHHLGHGNSSTCCGSLCHRLHGVRCPPSPRASGLAMTTRDPTDMVTRHPSATGTVPDASGAMDKATVGPLLPLTLRLVLRSTRARYHHGYGKKNDRSPIPTTLRVRVRRTWMPQRHSLPCSPRRPCQSHILPNHHPGSARNLSRSAGLWPLLQVMRGEAAGVGMGMGMGLEARVGAGVDPHQVR